MASKDACCPEADIAAGLMSVSAKELIARGMSDLLSADLNGDNFVDWTDMQLYMDGVQPRPLYENNTKQRGSNR